MAKLTKEELIKKVSEKIEDKELQIELMEDITDSFEIESDDGALNDLQVKFDELQEKYRQRFLEVEEVKEEIEEEKKDDSDDEIKEEEVIDFQEI